MGGQITACARSLSAARQQPQQAPTLPSAAFAAAATQRRALAHADASGPTFVIVTGGEGGGIVSPQVVEATLRLHGVGSKQQEQQQQEEQEQEEHHALRGAAVGSGADDRQPQQQDGLAVFAPTPECAAASRAASHLYANGRIPQCE